MKLHSIGSIALLLTLSAGVAACSRSSPSTTPVAASEISHAVVVKLDSTSVEDFYEAVGTVQSSSKTTLTARILGTISATHYREGDIVQADQLLVEIDDRDIATQARRADAGLQEAQATLDEIDHSIRAAESGKVVADANLKLAASTLERYTALRDRNSVSAHEFEEVESHRDSAKAEVDRAQASLEALRAKRRQVQARIEQAKVEIDAVKITRGYTRILSPIDGLVTSKLAEAGSQAAPGVPLIVIEDRKYEIDASVPESQLDHIRVGMRLQATVPSLNTAAIEGTVSAIIPTTDASTRSFTVKIAALGQPKAGLLRSGMFARIRVPAGKRNVVAVPTSAIRRQGQLTSVYVVDDSNAIRLRLIEAGQSVHDAGDDIEVLSGLKPGERVIVRPDTSVQDGARWQP